MRIANYFFSRFLDDSEKILQVAHRHILIFKYDAAKPFFFGMAIPLLMYYLFPNLAFGWLIWGFVGLSGVAYRFIDWYFDVFLLTNIGVIDIERNGFFDISSTRIEYHMIEGVSYQIKGFWRTVFNFGDLTIDKLGAQTSVSLNDAAHPKKLESAILKYQDKYVVSRSIRDHQALKGMLSEMIAYHVQNNKIDSN